MRKTLSLVILLQLLVALMCFEYELNYFYQDSGALCSDGYPAGFYVHLNESSTEWIVHVSGDGESYKEGTVEFCYDIDSCKQRPIELVSSMHWAKNLQDQDGILSNNPKTNPNFFSTNKVIVKYCTNDLYTGYNSASVEEINMSFLGETVLRVAIEQLSTLSGFAKATNVLLSGQGAGSIGIGFKMDKLVASIKTNAPQADVKISFDSSFFVSMDPIIPGKLPYWIKVLAGTELWNTIWDKRCYDSLYAKEEPYMCLFSYYILNNNFAPKYVMQNAQDPVMLDSLGCTPTDASCMGLAWNITRVQTLNGSPDQAFLPSCGGSHSIITTPSFFSLSIQSYDKKSYLLYDAFTKWYTGETKKGYQYVYGDSCYSYSCNPTCPK